MIKLKERKKVSVVIYDGKGIKVKTIANDIRDANTYNESWNGKNDSGNTVGSGVYMVFMEAGEYKETKKIVVIK